MATTKNLETLTVNRLSLAKYRELAAQNSINPEQVYQLSDADKLMTRSEISTAITAAVEKSSQGVLRTVEWSDVKNRPDMTTYATVAKVEQLINALIDQAPGTLDTFKEIADALGNDPNLATTLITKINAKVDSTTFQSAINGKADKTATEQAIAGKTAVVLKQWEE